MQLKELLVFLWAVPVAHGKGLWTSTGVSFKNIIRGAFPLGNGRLAAMPFGVPGAEGVVLNIDSLWSGGPFGSSSYNGGNPPADVSHYLPGIRKTVFQTGTGDVNSLTENANNYGSFQVYANLSITINGITSGTGYNRSLDFATGLHTTVFTGNDQQKYTSITYCSYPDQVCVYNLSSSATLPQISISLNNQLLNQSFFNATCQDHTIRLTGVTQIGPPVGMKFDGIASVSTVSTNYYCSESAPGTLVIPAGSSGNTFSIVIGANTNYDQKAGNSASNYSFQGVDPGPYVESVTSAASAKTESDLRVAHIADYKALAGQFTLNLPDIAASTGIETSKLIAQYNATGAGDPYLESTLFDYGRHLFISSQRNNSLPTNLAGKWSETLTAAWSADYHANINMQMNLWGADQTGLGALQSATWDYMEDTWAPRGADTAKLLYGAPGWAVHNEMNIFGYTGMKNGGTTWADYPASAAWMMQHVFDNFDYSQDVDWLNNQGYQLLTGIAEFWLSQLQSDTFFNDTSLVVNPCNSPEHGPTTFGCTHWQQLIHQLFINILSLTSVTSVSDADLVSRIETALETLDKGVHIGTWGEIKEWKLPDSYGYDFENDTHRHLSQLYGWYPGYSISSYLDGYSNTTIQNAVAISLYSRGPGIADANAGWEKVWRSACWARLNNTAEAYYELKLAIASNYAGNGLSMYSGKSPPFQIDANFGLLGAVLSMLIVDLPATEIVVLGPAIPATWGGGSVMGLRLRGGGSVDFEWDVNGLVTKAQVQNRTAKITVVNKNEDVLVQL